MRRNSLDVVDVRRALSAMIVAFTDRVEAEFARA
jgi:hypothetical protein